MNAFSDRLEFLAAGRNRNVYLSRSGKYVVKVPLNLFGDCDNHLEANRFYRKDGFFGPGHLARCRMAKLGGTWCLIMEIVKPSFAKDLPDWTEGVDCQQVGYNRKGKLVAYDFA